MAKSSGEPDFHLPRLKKSMYAQEPWDDVIAQLLLISQHDLEKEDENKLNILHHAIISNYAEVVHYLLNRGYFMELQQPSQIPYLHLACYHGHASIVNILMQERPNDFPPGLPEKVESGLVPKLNESGVGDSQLSSLRKFTPLDLASASKQIRCVQLLLSDDLQHGSMLERAVKHGSTECVRFLLAEDESITQVELNKAFKLALMRKLPGCLDRLMSRGVEVDLILNTMNPYHVMYMYTSGFQLHKIRNGSLDECTDVLIKHDMDVNVYYPGGSYPLYSLIHSMIEEKDFDPSTVPTAHMKAMESLLKAGANPNLDECALSRTEIDIESNFIFRLSLGRDPCYSAINALFFCIEQSESWDENGPEFYSECLEMLLKYDGDASDSSDYPNAPMHDLMRCMATQHAQGRYIDMLSLASILLKYGASLDVSNLTDWFLSDPPIELLQLPKFTVDMGPVVFYFMKLIRETCYFGNNLCCKWCHSACPGQMTQLLLYMKPADAYATYKYIVRAIDDQPDSGARLLCSETLSPLWAQHLFQPRTLLSVCSAEIWTHIGCNHRNIELIPVPKMVKNILYEMFSV